VLRYRAACDETLTYGACASRVTRLFKANTMEIYDQVTPGAPMF